jgi:hypothetical protein
MPNNSYSDGLISIAHGSTTLVGGGTAFTTQLKLGDQVSARDFGTGSGGSGGTHPWEILGWVSEVTDDTHVELLDPYYGTSLVDVEYRIVRGIGWWTGAAPNETMINLMTELDVLGLAGVTAGVPDPDVGRENQIMFDPDTNIIYMRISGTWTAMTFGIGSLILTAADILTSSGSPPSTIQEVLDALDQGITDLTTALADYGLLVGGNTWEDTQTFEDVVVGSATGGSKGAGTINAAAPYYQNGVAHWTPVRKLTDQTKTGTTTLAADSALSFAMAAATKYVVRGRIFFDTTAAGDFKWRHVGPASPTLVRVKRSSIDPAATAYGNIAVDTAYSAADITELSASTNGGFIEFEAIIHNGANAGNFEIHWAQNTSDGGNTVVRAGSYLEYVAF